jgi:hypothetical protein
MDTGDTSVLLHEAIAVGLRRLRMPDLSCHRTTFLIQNGHCVGQRFLFDGVQVVWLIAENVIQFYNENGRMLTSMMASVAEQEAA